MTPESLTPILSSMQGKNNSKTSNNLTNHPIINTSQARAISAAAILQTISTQRLIQNIIQQKPQEFVSNFTVAFQQRIQQQRQSQEERPISSTSSNSSNESENQMDDERKSPASPVDTVDPISSTSKPSSSRTSTTTTNGTKPVRKLKIYGIDEKLDIIDYAKVIGNRAAGREYNVAESSIREWRKNEKKLRIQAENTKASLPANREKEAFFKRLFDELVKYINSTNNVTWIMVRDKCQSLWKEYGEQYEEGQSLMHLHGWVARFIAKAREDKLIPEIAPPIAMPNTNNASNSTSSLSSNFLNGLSMVSSISAVDISPSTSSIVSPSPLKKSRLTTTKKALISGETTLSQSDLSKSRRKGVPTKRLLDATLKTSNNLPLDLTKKKDRNSNEANQSSTTSSTEAEVNDNNNNDNKNPSEKGITPKTKDESENVIV